MTHNLRLVLLLALMMTGWSAMAEQHRATRLGDPETRFAPTMETPDDLRARFQDENLRPDFIEVLRQWGWPGNLDDFFNAGLTNEIIEVEIPVGSVLPFMSTRRQGKPLCLRNVIWAGKEPIAAYAFNFASNGRMYRCIIPKPCSNFFVVDLGPEPVTQLAVDCSAPDKIMAGHEFETCVNIHNLGNFTGSNVIVSLPVPEHSTVTATTDGGMVTNNSVQWEILNLPAKATKTVCAKFRPGQAGTLLFIPGVRSDDASRHEQRSWSTEVSGIPAILLEDADDPDPVSLGNTTTYTIKVTNQGTADDTNVQVVATIAAELIPVSASEGSINGQTVAFPVVPRLEPKQSLTYTIAAKGIKTGDGHTRFNLSSDMLRTPIYAEESTIVY